jgi:hypothetical protein
MFDFEAFTKVARHPAFAAFVTAARHGSDDVSRHVLARVQWLREIPNMWHSSLCWSKAGDCAVLGRHLPPGSESEVQFPPFFSVEQCNTLLEFFFNYSV